MKSHKIKNTVAKSYGDIPEIVLITFNDKKTTCKMGSCFILLTFLLVSILSLGIAVNCYCFIKHGSKQKYTLLINDNLKMKCNNESKGINVKNMFLF